MRFYFPDTPDIPLTPGHRFPAGKYRMLRDLATAERLFGDHELTASPACTIEDLRRAHDDAYVQAVTDGTLSPAALRRLGLPWSQTLVARSRATVGGTLAAAQSALDDGLSGQLAGGTHHAHRDFGSGFCVFNDLAVATLALLNAGRVRRVAIVDLDVHQGDGNAAILGGDDRVFVLSIQGAKNFPFRRVPSTLDIELPDGTSDNSYLAALGPALERLEDFKPDLMLYLSGADPLAEDRLGRLSLSMAGLEARDRLVFSWCRRRHLPVSIAIGGGYAQPIELSVRAYANTFRSALSELG